MEKLKNNEKIVYISSDTEEDDMCFNFVQNSPKIGMSPKNEDEGNIRKVVDSAKTDPIENSDSIVLRKLLRGARYFDPPDSGNWGSCYNCGEEGHTSVNCTSAKRKRPCFICGSLEHHAKQCLKGQYCYICKKGGHRTKACPEKNKRSSKWNMCLKCGDSGHYDMFSCDNDYLAEDLKDCGKLEKAVASTKKGKAFVSTRKEKAVARSPGNRHMPKEVGPTANDCPSLSSTKGCSESEKVVISPGNCYMCNEVGHIAKNCPSSTKDCSILHSKKSKVRSRGKCRGCGEKGHIARDCPGSTKDCGKSQKVNAKSPRKCFKCDEDGHFARDCLASTKDCGEPRQGTCFKCGKDGHYARECLLSDEDRDESRNKRCFTCGKEGHFARECLLSNEVGKRSSELSTPLFKSSNRGFKKSKSSTSAAFKDRKRKEADIDEGESARPYSLKKRDGWIADDPVDLFSRDAQMRHWNSPVAPTYSEHMNYATGVRGHDFRSSDTPYRSASYGHGPSDEFYHQYRHAHTNESYHRYEHGPPDEIYPRRHPPSNRVDEVSSNRLHHRYVVSPPYPAYADSPSRGSPLEVGGPAYMPSHSYEVARPHSYLASEPPTFFEQIYRTSRFNNSRSDGMERTGPWNRY